MTKLEPIKSWSQNFVALVSGLVFSIGLGVAGMTRPEKIINFLNVFGAWDPSLLVVMTSAVSIHFISYRLIKNRRSPILDSDWHLPKESTVTWELVLGSVLFGIGWGLGGFCPGPAVTAIASGALNPVLFVLSMIVGMFLFRRTQSRRQPSSSSD